MVIVMTFAMTVTVFANQDLVNAAAAAVVEQAGALAATRPATADAAVAWIDTNVLTGAHAVVTIESNTLTVTPATATAAGSIAGNVVLEFYDSPTTYTATATIPATVIPQLPPRHSQDVTVTGAGAVTYAAAEPVWSFVLPTTAGLGFIIDPLGLTGAEVGAPIDLGALDGGIIAPAGNAVSVINNSSERVALQVTVTGTYTSPGDNASPTFIDEGANIGAVETAVNEGEDNNVALFLVPGTGNVTAPGATFAASDLGVGVTGTAATANFVLPAATSTTTWTGTALTTAVTAGAGNGTMFQVAGYANENASWADFTRATNPSTIGVSVVFRVSEILSDAEVGTSVANVAHMVNNTAATPSAAQPWHVTPLGTSFRAIADRTPPPPALGFFAAPNQVPAWINITSPITATIDIRNTDDGPLAIPFRGAQGPAPEYEVRFASARRINTAGASVNMGWTGITATANTLIIPASILETDWRGVAAGSPSAEVRLYVHDANGVAVRHVVTMEFNETTP